MPCWLVEGHFEHNYSKIPSVKRNRTRGFLNDMELYACVVWSPPLCFKELFLKESHAHTHLLSPLYTLVPDSLP